MTDQTLPKTQRETDVRRSNKGGLQLFIPEGELRGVAVALSVAGTDYPQWLADQISKYSKATTAAPVA